MDNNPKKSEGNSKKNMPGQSEGLGDGNLPVSPLDKGSAGKEMGGGAGKQSAFNPAKDLPTSMDNLKSAPLGVKGGAGDKLAKSAAGGGAAKDPKQSKTLDALKKLSDKSDGGAGGKAGKKVPKTPMEKNTEAKAGKAEQAANLAIKEGLNKFIAPGAGTAFEKAGGIRGVGVILLVTVVISLIPLFTFFYIMQNPDEIIGKVLTNQKLRDYGYDLARAFGKNILKDAIDALPGLGEVDYHGPNTAIAAAPTTIPPGSTLERLSKIDWKKAQYQTLDKKGCGYELKLKQVINSEGRVRFVPDYVVNTKTDTTIQIDNLSNNILATNCIQQQYPIFNLMARQPVTREINQLADVRLNYASKKDTEEFRRNKAEVDRYVYDKTLNRITPKKEDSIDFSNYQGQIDIIQNSYRDAVREYNAANPDDQIPYSDDKSNLVAGINKMYEDMAAGKSPYDMQLQSYINIPTKDNGQSRVVTTGLANTLCPFIMGFLDLGDDPTEEESAKNARKAIESRLASTERGAIKITTLADTRKADQLSNVENNSTIAQQDNWASSAAYSIDVHNSLNGVQQNPEATSTRSYNARQTALYDTEAIQKLKNGCVFISAPGGIFGDALADTGNKMVADGYRDLKLEIVAQSEGVFNSPSDFGLKEIITSFVRTGSVTAVSGLESGPDNYNRQAAGFRQLMNDYFLRIGGRFLTETEANQVAIDSENLRREEEKDRGVGYRLFALDNIRSARSIINQNTVTPKTAMTAGTGLFKQLLNPLKSLANIHSSALYYSFGQHNKAFAANTSGDKYLKIDTAGIPQGDFNISMLENATYIENLKANGSPAEKRKLTHYDSCFKQKIPTSQYFKIRTKPLSEIGNRTLTDSIRDKYPGANAVQWFIFHPEWHRGVILDANGNVAAVRTDDPEGKFNKFNDCKEILQDAKDINSLPVKYRMYVYYNIVLDQMASLSSDADNPSIYANSGTSGPTGPIGAPDPDADTSGTPCPSEPGITTSTGPNLVNGVAQTYGPGQVPANKIMVCDVAAPGGGVIDINVSLASQLNKLLKDAQAAGILFGGGGFRSYEEQVGLRTTNGCPDVFTASPSSCRVPTAIPGTSNHEKGLAIDFTTGGNTIDRGSPGFNWLVANAANYGLINLESEPWHWSVTGG